MPECLASVREWSLSIAQHPGSNGDADTKKVGRRRFVLICLVGGPVAAFLTFLLVGHAAGQIDGGTLPIVLILPPSAFSIVAGRMLKRSGNEVAAVGLGSVLLTFTLFVGLIVWTIYTEGFG